MDVSNCQTTMPKTLPNQLVFCPWTSRAPLALPTASRHGQKCSQQQDGGGSLPQNCFNCQQACFNNHQLNLGKPHAGLSCPSMQQSSSQFFHFLRLMQLFPDVHPATLHTVLVLCKGDFFNAVDKLLYAQRCKQMYNSRRTVLHACSTSKCARHKPYCCLQPVVGNSSATGLGQISQSGNGYIQSPFLMHGFGQVLPLDVSFKKAHCNRVQSASVDKGHESTSKGTHEFRKILPRNRTKTKDNLAPTSATDLPPVASPQCKLPIRPLSPLNEVPEDLSDQSSAKENNNTEI